MNPVNERLGRKRYTARAQREKVLQVCKQIEAECPPKHWKRDLARSVQDIIDIDDCKEVHGAAE